MSQKVNHKSEYRCDICIKYYASKSSLCNHNKKYHLNNVHFVNDIVHDVHDNVHVLKNKEYNCINCNKIFSSRQGRCNHQKICKIKKSIDIELKLKKAELEILKLKLKLEQTIKPDNMTLKQINRKLICSQ